VQSQVAAERPHGGRGNSTHRRGSQNDGRVSRLRTCLSVSWAPRFPMGYWAPIPTAYVYWGWGPLTSRALCNPTARNPRGPGLRGWRRGALIHWIAHPEPLCSRAHGKKSRNIAYRPRRAPSGSSSYRIINFYFYCFVLYCTGLICY
jgi:hypothetical protein